LADDETVKSLAGFVGFQAAWWAAALLARAHRPGLAALAMLAFVVAHVALRRRGVRGASGLLACTAALLGLAVEGALRSSGMLSYDAAIDGAPAPAFMIALWAGFACTLQTSLRSLTKRPLLGVSVGAVGGALAYRAGEELGVLDVHGPVAFAAVAVAWALATPLLGAFAALLDGETAARRARTIPRVLGLAILACVLAPIVWPVAVIVDVARFVVARRPFMSVRVLAFGFFYLGCELVGLVVLCARPSIDATYRIQEWFGARLFGAVRTLFRLRFEVSGDDVIREVAMVSGARPVVMVRHTSIIDALLPTFFITRAHGLRLRFVLKRELLEDPCLDVAGTRLPNHFAARSGAGGAGEDVAAIRALAAGLAVNEGAVIYPEGTRFTVEKRARSLEKLARDAPELIDDARALVHLMPPKPAGVGALLDGARDAGTRGDVIVVAHDGLEGFAHVADIWSGALLGRTVRVHMWRASPAPNDPRERAHWLYAEWRKMDAWLS
jgi:1-acyl-sn-glycerol-3-phosphate acyltransferase